MAGRSSLFRYPAAVVIWDDAHARNQAVEYTEDEVLNLHRAEEVRTLGLILKDDQTGISLYTEETGPDAIRGANFIPAAMIKEIIYLGDLRRTKRRAKKDGGHESVQQRLESPERREEKTN